MSINYRVRAHPAESDDDIIMENFENLSDAKTYYESLQNDSDGIIDALPYPAVLISFEEFINGTWTFISKRVVVK